MPSKSVSTTAGATTSATTRDGRVARRRKHNTQNFNNYIYKVLKEVHPEHGVSKKAIKVLNSFCGDMFERICLEASRVARYSKSATLTTKHIQTAVQLTFPGELSKHAVSSGVQSVMRYNQTRQ